MFYNALSFQISIKNKILLNKNITKYYKIKFKRFNIFINYNYRIQLKIKII